MIEAIEIFYSLFPEEIAVKLIISNLFVRKICVRSQHKHNEAKAKSRKPKLLKKWTNEPILSQLVFWFPF